MANKKPYKKSGVDLIEHNIYPRFVTEKFSYFFDL